MVTSGGPLQDVATGQKLMIAAIGVNIAAFVVARNLGSIPGVLVGLLAFGVAITGVQRATAALGYSTLRQFVYMGALLIGTVIPIIAVAVLALVSSEATKLLRSNGVDVGLLGAKGL